MKIFEDYMKGGLADNMSVADVAKKHGVDISSIKSQLQLGIKTELEHVDDRNKAREIALDHLVEDPQYYSKLKKANL